MRDALLLLAGSLLGLVGATVGSVVIGRIELRRQVRLRIYEEVLPKLRDILDESYSAPRVASKMTSLLNVELKRACLLLSKREHALRRELTLLQEVRVLGLDEAPDWRDLKRRRRREAPH